MIVRAKLTIEAGVVVKFYSNRTWNLHYGMVVDGANGGSLQVQGTSVEPVIFTSWFDDVYSGDTDGSPTDVAEVGDHSGLRFIDDNNSLIQNAEFYYGGADGISEGTLVFKNSQVNLKDIKISKSWQPGILMKNDSRVEIENLEAMENKNEVLQLNDTSRATINNINWHNNYGQALIKISAAADLSGSNYNFYDNSQPEIQLVPYEINGEAIWRNWGLPYWSEGDITISATGKLNVAAGVLVRWGGGTSRLLNLGELNINGAPGQEVVFTSWLAQPVSQDDYWGGVVFENGAHGSVNYFTIKNAGVYYSVWTGASYLYSEYNALRISDATPQFDHLTVEESAVTGINIIGSTPLIINNCLIKDSGLWGVTSDSTATITFRNCSFGNSYYEAIKNFSQTPVDARYNWWGHNSGPNTLQHPQGQGQKIWGLALYDPWLGKENLAVTDLEPVIVVPGIMGSWKRKVCGIDPVTNLYQCESKYVPDPILGTYDSLWQALKNIGYEEDENLFAFGYNWRESNIDTASLLKQKIQAVKSISGKNKVDLVVHSMGGLVARAYIQSVDYAGDVDQVIFLGTPQLGAPEAYEKYEAVEGFKKREELIAKTYFGFEAFLNGYTDLVKYVREKIPALNELLPIYDYLKKKVGDYWVFRTYPTENYPQNIFLENLNEPTAISLLKQVVQITNIVSNYLPQNTVVDIRTVADPDPTDNKWIHGYPENYGNSATDRGLEYGVGDGTVPMTSADGLPGVAKILCEGNPIHREMPTECQRHIIQALTGKWPSNVFRATFIQKLLMIYVHSPVKFQVIDSNGQITGTDFTNNNGLESIPNSLFDEENGFVFIKNPGSGEYKINVMGIEDGGNYGLSINNISESGGQESLVQGTIAAGEVQNYQINYDSNSSAPVVIEEVKTKITIDDIIKDVRDIAAQGGFKQKNLDKILITQLQLAKRWEAKLAAATKEFQKRIYRNLILIDLRVAENLLKVWLKTKKINQASYEILIKDFNLLIQQYQLSS